MTVPDQVETLTKRFGLRGSCWSATVACSRKLRLIRSRNTRPWAGSRRAQRCDPPAASRGPIPRSGRTCEAERAWRRLARRNSLDDRLVACYNPQLAAQRRKKREEFDGGHARPTSADAGRGA